MEISLGLLLGEDVFEKECLKLMLTVASKKNQNNHLQNGHYIHCVKSIQIRSYFWSVFPCIRTGYGDLLIFLYSDGIVVYEVNFHAVMRTLYWKDSFS